MGVKDALKQIKIIEYKHDNVQPRREELSDDLKYWSNSCGELHHRGEYDIKEEDLPNELKRAYRELYADVNGSLCYLIEYKGEYGIALVNEFDECFADEINFTMKFIYSHMQSVAEELIKLDEYKESLILLGECTGFFECHEFITILPWNIDKSKFNKVADILCEGVYKF